MINDFSTLQAKVAQWLARADLATVIPDFIQLAEARINLDLRTAAQQVATSGTTVGGSFTLPTDCRQIQALIVTYGGIELELHPVAPEKALNEAYISVPSEYTVLGNTVNILFNADTAYRLVYFQGVPSLADATPQNWLILTAPQVYLYATCLEASVYLRDDARTQLFGLGYKTAVDGLLAQSDSLRYSPSPRMRVDFYTP